MTIKKFTAVTAADTTVAITRTPVELVAMALKSSADATVSLTVTDYNGRTIATWASADYTTRTVRNLGPAEPNIFDTGGDPSADLEHTPIGVLVDGPVTLTVGATVGSGDLAVEFFYRPVTKVTAVIDTTNAAPVVAIPDGQSFHRVLGMAVKSSSDTSVALTVTDAFGKTIATWASADYTTRALRHLAEVETAVFDTGGDASADTEGNEVGVFADGALTLTSAGMAAGTLTVEIYAEA